MSRSAAFYVGTGKKAISLLCIKSGGCPADQSLLLSSRTEKEFRNQVAEVAAREFGPSIRVNFPWQRITNYVYAWFDGHVWVTTGGHWFNPFIRVRRPRALPPPPVTRKGVMEGTLTVTCGECSHQKQATAKQLSRWAKKCLTADLETYFTEKGWQLTRRQGWRCPRCQKTR